MSATYHSAGLRAAPTSSGAATQVFEALKGKLAANPDAVDKVKCIFAFEVKGAGDWLVDLKNGKGEIKTGKGKADCTLILSEDDLVKLVDGKLNAQTAFMQGKLKIKGNMMKAQKLEVLLKAKGGPDAMKGAVGGAAPAPAGKTAAVFAQLKAILASEPGIVKKANTTFQFEVKGGGDWVVDLKNGNGDIREGKAKCDCTLILGEEEFLSLVSGKLNPQTAFMQGKLKIKGNMMKAQKLEAILKPMAPKAKL